MKITGLRAFQDKTSAEARLNMTYNRSKHTDSAIARAQMPARGPLAMWLDNDGLRTTDSLLEWAELHDILDETGQTADLLQDPADEDHS